MFLLSNPSREIKVGGGSMGQVFGKSKQIRSLDMKYYLVPGGLSCFATKLSNNLKCLFSAQQELFKRNSLVFVCKNNRRMWLVLNIDP